MEVILLERIARLGQMGDVVKVKTGYARNYLLPQGKALRANEANMARFEVNKAHLEARNLERKHEAEAVHEKLEGNTYMVIRSAGETGQLYGSVSARDIAIVLEENGFSVARNQINLLRPIKVIGMHGVKVVLHPEVESSIAVNVARSADEAARQAAGEDLTGRVSFDRDEADDEDTLDLEEVFENPEEAEAELSDAETADENGDGEQEDSKEAAHPEK